MNPGITELVEGSDNFEIIRDQIAAILSIESQGQQAIAVSESKDPGPWKLRVFTERADPIEFFQDAPPQSEGIPVVNVWFDNAAVDAASSNTVERQRITGTYNVDCYGYGIASVGEADDYDVGHQPADEKAAFEAHRAARLCRRFLMAGKYTYLALRGTVWRRMVQSISAFQPALNDRPIQRVVGVRLALSVVFNELSPQVVGAPFETLAVTLKRTETGEIYATATYAADP